MFEEPGLQTAPGLRKSDIVATKGDIAHVIDSYVVWEQVNLAIAVRRKRDYYQLNPDIDPAIRCLSGLRRVEHIPLLVSWRGIWSLDSWNGLRANRRLSAWDDCVITTRVLVGSWICFRQFECMTSHRHGYVHMTGAQYITCPSLKDYVLLGVLPAPQHHFLA